MSKPFFFQIVYLRHGPKIITTCLMSPSSHLTLKLLFKKCHYYSKLDFFLKLAKCLISTKKIIILILIISKLGLKLKKQVLGPIPILIFGFSYS